MVRWIPLEHSQVRPEGADYPVAQHWGDQYTSAAKAGLVGGWKVGDLWGGVAQGTINIAPFNDSVPQDVQEMVIAAKKAIRKK